MSRDLASALSVLRICRGWTRSELARAAGVPNSSLSQYERGQKTPELKTLSRLVDAMGFPLAAVDQTRDFLTHLRSGRIGRAEVPRHPARGNHDVGEEPLDVERLATEVGSAAENLARAVLLLFDRADRADPRSRLDAKTPLERELSL